jgi:hypothetical protein
MTKPNTSRAPIPDAPPERPITRHDVKCWGQPFAEFRGGRKRADVRRADDRDYRRGDELLEREYVASEDRFTGAALLLRITHVTRFAGALPITLQDDRGQLVAGVVLSVQLLQVGTYEQLAATQVLR